MRYCSSCGTLNDTDAKFCAGCGKRLGEAMQENVIAVENAAGMTLEHESTPVFEAASSSEPAYAAEPQPVSAPAPEVAASPDPSSNQPEENPVKGRVLGGIGFGLNLEALIFCWAPYTNVVTLIMSIAGLILCGLSKKYTDFKLARTGKTLGIIALIFSIVTIVLYIVLIVLFIANYGDELTDLISQSTDGLINIYFGN